MIPRYSRKEMADIWSDQNKYQIWLDIEANAVEAMEKLGQVPTGTAQHIFDNAKFDVEANIRN